MVRGREASGCADWISDVTRGTGRRIGTDASVLSDVANSTLVLLG